MDGELVVIRIGPLIYSNFAMRCNFVFSGDKIARHLFWRFWIYSGENHD